MGAYALIAETDPPHAAVYRDAAAAEGLEAIVARDGEQALALCRERGMPALVITDLTLARLDGFGLLRELRRAAPKNQPPAIVVSAFKELRGAADTLKDQLAIKAILPKTRQLDTMRRSLKRVMAGLPPEETQSFEEAEREATVEAARLATIDSMGIVDGAPPDEVLQSLVRMTAEAFRVPVALISLILEDKQWFKAYFGLPDDVARARETPRDWAFCRHVVQGKAPLVVPDARTHPYFSANPMVKAGLVGSYAGAPLVTPRGDVLGTLCIIDSKPLGISADEVQTLALLARRAAGELEMRSAAWSRLAPAASPGATTGIIPVPLSHTDLETTLTHIDSAVLLLDSHRRVLFASPAFADLFERPVRIDPGMSRDDFLRQIAGYFDNPGEFLRRLGVDNSGPYSGREICRIVTPRPKIVRWTARPVHRGSGFGQLESFTDITGED